MKKIIIFLIIIAIADGNGWAGSLKFKGVPSSWTVKQLDGNLPEPRGNINLLVYPSTAEVSLNEGEFKKLRFKLFSPEGSNLLEVESDCNDKIAISASQVPIHKNEAQAEITVIKSGEYTCNVYFSAQKVLLGKARIAVSRKDKIKQITKFRAYEDPGESKSFAVKHTVSGKTSSGNHWKGEVGVERRQNNTGGDNRFQLDFSWEWK